MRRAQARTSWLRLNEVFAIFQKRLLTRWRFKCGEQFTVYGNSATQRRDATNQDLPLGWTGRLLRTLLDPRRHLSRS